MWLLSHSYFALHVMHIKKRRLSSTMLCSVHACSRIAPLVQLTHIYQLNKPPPLGSPDCQFPEITEEGVCANQIVYIPTARNAVRTHMDSLCV